jgi:hypothetical protein
MLPDCLKAMTPPSSVSMRKFLTTLLSRISLRTPSRLNNHIVAIVVIYPDVLEPQANPIPSDVISTREESWSSVRSISVSLVASIVSPISEVMCDRLLPFGTG